MTGVLTIAAALSYGELAGMMPRAGGQYVYLREAYSPLWGFLYGWTLFLVIQTGTIAAVAVAFGKFLGVFVPELGTNYVLFSAGEFKFSSGQFVAAALILLLTAVNCRGVTTGTFIQNVFTVAKTLALMLLIVVGLFLAADPEIVRTNWQDAWSGIQGTVRFHAVQ